MLLRRIPWIALLKPTLRPQIRSWSENLFLGITVIIPIECVLTVTRLFGTVWSRSNILWDDCSRRNWLKLYLISLFFFVLHCHFNSLMMKQLFGLW